MKNKGFLTRFIEWARGSAVSKARADAPSFAAVTVTSTGELCAAARASAASPILLSTEPRLPLAQCSMPDQCVCRFRHWPDRRIGERRLPINADGAPPSAGDAKPRSGHDRRRK